MLPHTLSGGQLFFNRKLECKVLLLLLMRPHCAALHSELHYMNYSVQVVYAVKLYFGCYLLEEVKLFALFSLSCASWGPQDPD